MSDGYHHGDLPNALVAAAIELLGEVGPSFTLRQVAARVGVTHTAAYRHFEDRRALLAEVARRGYLDLARTLRASASRARTPRSTLEAIVGAYVRFGWKRRAQYELMFGPRLNRDGRFPELEEAVRQSVRVLQQACGELLGTDEARVTRDLGMAVWAFAHGYTSTVLQRRIHVRSMAAAERYAKTLVAPLLDGATP